jgi:hypothetical protein
MLIPSIARSYKATRVISKFSKKKLWNNIIIFEFKLINVLVNSGLIKSYTDGLTVLRLNSIFVNRAVIRNPCYTLAVGDIIELLFSKIYFIYLVKFKHICEKHIIKLRNKIWLKFAENINVTTSNENDIIKVYLNNWLFKYNIPNYLEIDYFTLSIFIVSNLKNINDISFFFRRFFSLYLFRLYNWKWLA